MKRINWLMIALILAAAVTWCAKAWCSDIAGEVRKPVTKAIQIRQKIQRNSDQWAEEKARLQAEYKTLEEMHQHLLSMQEKLQKKRDIHATGVEELENQKSEMTRLSNEIAPFLQDTLDRLNAFVDSDLPFLADERTERLKRLKTILDDPAYSVGEKYRKTMEALIIEVEYGNTIEVYDDKITIEDERILAHVFRLGRISMFFETLDHRTTGVYDPSAGAWKVLPVKYNTDIGKAIEIGMKRRSIELLTLPLGRIAAQ